MTGILEATNVKKHYPMGNSIVRALDGVSITMDSGEFLGLLGTSGSGKSTMLNLIAGLDRPTAGNLKILQKDLASMSRGELSEHRRKTVGMIFQSFNLIPTMSALENVALAMMFAEKPRLQRERRAQELLATVGLSERQTHKPRELSGGEQQRVSIARALANDPAILLADEPTGNLDSQTAREILELLGRLNKTEAKTIIMVTHDSILASHFVDRTVVLLDGKVLTEERP